MRDLGWNWEKEEIRQGDEFLVGKCPMHHGQSRFDVRASNGYWKCWSECGEGNIEEMYAVVSRMTNTAAISQLKERVGVGSSSHVAKLPSQEDLVEWEMRLDQSPDAKQYLASHAISRKVAANHSIGFDGKRFCIPSFDQLGSLANVKRFYLHSPKEKKPLAGRRQDAYPWPHILNWDEEKPIIICEGEPDALALISIGQNVCTTTGGVQKLKDHIPWSRIPEGGSVVIALDSDDAGNKAATALFSLARKKKPGCTIRRVNIPAPHNDVADFLAAIPDQNRAQEWEELVDSSFSIESASLIHRGIYESGGATYAEANDEPEMIAPFTGVILESGPVVEDGEERGRGYKVRLTHGNTGESIEVDYCANQMSFDKAIESCASSGPEWNIMKRDADRVFDYICRKTTMPGGPGYRKIGYGWLFGYRDRKCEKFYTPSSIYTQVGCKANDEISMEPVGEFLERLHIPMPDRGRAKDGMRLMWEHATICHHEEVMYPILMSAIIAPVRRVLSPSDPPFMVFLRGQTQACKTTRAKVGQCFYGDYWDEQSLMTFQGTIKYLEAAIARCGDSLAMIDELDYGKMSDTEKRDAKRWLQGTAQGFGRGRMSRDGGIKVSNAAHAIRMITCEQLPEGDQSLIGRGLVVNVPRIDPLDPKYLKPHTTVETNRDLLPYVTSAWIDDVMRSTDRWREIYNAAYHTSGDAFVRIAEEEYGPLWREIAQMSRTYNRLRMFFTYARVFLDYCRQQDGISLQTYQHCLDTWEGPVLRALMRSQVDAVSSGGALSDIMIAVEACLASGSGQFHYTASDEFYPRHAKSGSDVIGVIVEVSGRMVKMPEYEKCAITLRNKKQVLALTAGIQKLWGEGMAWNQIRRYLVDGEVAMEIGTGRLRGQRALVLKREHALTLVNMLNLGEPVIRNSSD